MSEIYKACPGCGGSHHVLQPCRDDEETMDESIPESEYARGYAQAERDIVAWLYRRSIETDRLPSASAVARIQRGEHRPEPDGGKA